MPLSLKEFIDTATKLTLPRDLDPNIIPVNIPESVKRGMIPKKHHEVSHMAAVVQTTCHGSELILDVGSGLVRADHLILFGCMLLQAPGYVLISDPDSPERYGSHKMRLTRYRL